LKILHHSAVLGLHRQINISVMKKLKALLWGMLAARWFRTLSSEI
jgi:hypothetical protein